MLESLLMQQCFPIGVQIFIWTYWTPCGDIELARTLAPLNTILSVVILSAIALVIYKRKMSSKKTWKQIIRTELSILKQVAIEPVKDAWHVIEDYQRASRLKSNG